MVEKMLYAVVLDLWWCQYFLRYMMHFCLDQNHLGEFKCESFQFQQLCVTTLDKRVWTLGITVFTTWPVLLTYLLTVSMTCSHLYQNWVTARGGDAVLLESVECPSHLISGVNWSQMVQVVTPLVSVHIGFRTQPVCILLASGFKPHVFILVGCIGSGHMLCS